MLTRSNKSAERVAPVVSKPVLTSLAAFIGAGLRPTTPLARAIVAVLVIKLVAIAAVFTVLSAAERNATVDAATIMRLLGPSPQP